MANPQKKTAAKAKDEVKTEGAVNVSAPEVVTETKNETPVKPEVVAKKAKKVGKTFYCAAANILYSGEIANYGKLTASYFGKVFALAMQLEANYNNIV